MIDYIEFRDALGVDARAWFDPHRERIHENARSRRGDLLQLEQIAMGYPSREPFLTKLKLDPPDANSGQAGVAPAPGALWMLTVTKDQQIIVLSCRTRASSDLGGTRAFIETDAI